MRSDAIGKKCAKVMAPDAWREPTVSELSESDAIFVRWSRAGFDPAVACGKGHRNPSLAVVKNSNLSH